MSATLVNEHPARAARDSAVLRTTRARQRLALRDLPCRDVVSRLLHPTPELASFRLDVLLAPERTVNRPIPGFGKKRFEFALALLRRAGNDWADPKLRLRQLNLCQRRRLVGAILRAAPQAWSGRD